MEETEQKKMWDKIGCQMHQTTCAMKCRRNRDVEELGLTSSQMDVILFVLCHEDKEIYQVDVERALRLSNPTVTGLLKRLEGKGFLVRTTGTKDRRCKQIQATRKAEEVRNHILKKRDETNELLFQSFSEEELVTFSTLMKKCHDNVVKMRESACSSDHKI